MKSEVVYACVLHERHLAAHLRAEPLIEYREPLDVARLKPLTEHVVDRPQKAETRAKKAHGRQLVEVPFIRVIRKSGFEFSAQIVWTRPCGSNLNRDMAAIGTPKWGCGAFDVAG